jgi:hypothetical protein
MQTKPATIFRFSITALLALTAGVAFLSSILIESLRTEPSAPHLIAKTLPFRANSANPDVAGTTPLPMNEELEQRSETRLFLLYQSLVEAIADAVGYDTGTVTVSRIEQNAPDGSLTVHVHWHDSSAPDVLVLNCIAPNCFCTSISSPDGSTCHLLTIDLQNMGVAVVDAVPNGKYPS